MPEFSPEQSIPERFEAVVRAFGARPAVLTERMTLTYDQLNRLANCIAHAVLARAPAPQTPAAILMRHDVALFPAMLGALKARKVVTVLNPTDPPARQLEALRHADPSILLCDSANETFARQAGVPMLNVENVLEGPDVNPGLAIAPTDLAFLLYTSGSAGAPKAVMQTHRNILHNILRYTISLTLTERDRILLLASLSGGQGMATTWQAFLNGGAIVPFAAMEHGVTGLAHCMQTQGVTIYISSASLFRSFAQTLSEADRFDTVRVVRLGSESARAEAYHEFRRHFSPAARMCQTYSASETGNITQHAMEHNNLLGEEILPVGVPSFGIEIMLQDEQGKTVRPGESGEIVVLSPYLSPGYWKNDELTHKLFRDVDGTRAYRTGDLGRWQGGVLHHLGRNDHLVKVRGHRVELHEIEAALLRLPEVRDAVTVTRPLRETQQIVAYVTPRNGAAIDRELLRAKLRDVLPRHMVPGAIVILDRLPLNAHGKIDRHALPPPAQESANEDTTTDAQRIVAEIWGSVLKTAVGRDADFFDLGGDSLAAAVIAARLNAHFGIALDFRFFVEHPRVSQQAAVLESATTHDDRLPPLQPAPGDGPVPLTLTQEGAYRRYGTSSRGYVAAVAQQITGPLRAEVLEKCLNRLVARHGALRTVIQVIAGVPMQLVRPPRDLPLPVVDVSGAADPEARANDLLLAEARKPIDVATGPLSRFVLVKLAPERHQLLQVNHHLVTDAWSWRLFYRELAEAYDRELAGTVTPESPRLQYADFALWQRQTLSPDSPAYRELVDWWVKELAGCEEIRLPFARRKARAKWLPYLRPWLRRKSLYWWGMPADVSESLAAMARQLGITGFAARLGVFVALLAETTGGDDFVIGVSAANRPRPEMQEIFGFFGNRIPVRLRVDRTVTLGTHLRHVQTIVAETQARASLSYELLEDEFRARGLKMPALHATFALTFHQETYRFGGVELAWCDRHFEAMPAHFNLAFDQHREHSHNRAHFHPFKHDARGVKRFLDRYLRALAAAPGATEQPLTGFLHI